MKNESKSPLNDKQLRYVAQSADERLDGLLHDKILLYHLAGCGLAVLIFYQWFRYLKPLDQLPVVTSIIGEACFVVCAYKVYKHIRKVKSEYLKQGRDGQRAVGQYLELFRESGCYIYHDILGNVPAVMFYSLQTCQGFQA